MLLSLFFDRVLPVIVVGVAVAAIVACALAAVGTPLLMLAAMSQHQ
jgi:hypothetical protein